MDNLDPAINPKSADIVVYVATRLLSGRGYGTDGDIHGGKLSAFCPRCTSWLVVPIADIASLTCHEDDRRFVDRIFAFLDDFGCYCPLPAPEGWDPDPAVMEIRAAEKRLDEKLAEISRKVDEVKRQRSRRRYPW